MKALVFVALVFCSSIASAKHARQNNSGPASNLDNIRYLSVEEGLASREAQCGMQDSKGFVWIGTSNGLNRYDGKNFLLFTAEKNGMQDNRVIQLAEDDSANLWVLYGQRGRTRFSIGKVDVVNLATKEVTSLSKKFSHLPFKENDVMWFGPNGEGEVVIVTRPMVVYLWSHAKGFRKLYEGKKAFNQFNPNQVFHGKDIWVVNGGAELVHVTDGKFREMFHQPNEMNFFPVEVLPDGNCRGFARIKEEKRVVSKELTTDDQLINTNFIESEETDALNQLWNKEILSFYDPFSNTSLIYNNSYGMALFEKGAFFRLMNTTAMQLFPTFVPYAYFTDRQQQKWVCSNAGVFIIKVKMSRFSRYFTHHDVPLQTYGNQVRGIYSDSAGNIYANVWNYLFYFGRGKGVNDIVSYRTTLIPMITQGNMLWAAGDQMLEYDMQTGRKKFITVVDSLREAWALYRHPDGKIFGGSANGIFIYNTSTGGISYGMDKDSLFRTGIIYRIMESSDHKIWAAGQSGLYVLDENGSIKEYYGPDAKENGHRIPSGNLHDVFEDAHGIFWIATDGEGLIRWDRKANTFRKFTTVDGLSSNLTYCVLQDDAGNLWVSSDYGLMKIDTTAFRIKTYTTRDGISHNEFNRVSAFRATSGLMYFGGIDGLNVFDPKDFRNDTARFNLPMQFISLTQFSSKEKELVDMTEPLLEQNKVIIQPTDKFFNLEFMLLDFEETQHHYAYMIEGIDKDWIYTNENSIRFSNPPYGKFTIHVKGQNTLGEWSADELRIPLVVLKPFYLSAWFIIITFLFLSGIVFIVIRWRVNRLKKDKEKLEEIVEQRTEDLKQSLQQKDVLLKEIHHRVKNNLTVISSLLELQSNGIEDEVAKAAIMEGQNRVRSIALIHHKLYRDEDLATIEFEAFINELYRQVASVFKHPLQHVNVEIDVPQTYFDIDTAVPLGLIANELLTNAYKYAFGEGRAGCIKIKLSTNGDGEYVLVFSDNGPGIPKDTDIKKSKSLGLRLISRLSAQIGGNMDYRFENGSTFVIHFKDTKTRKQIA